MNETAGRYLIYGVMAFYMVYLIYTIVTSVIQVNAEMEKERKK